MERILVVATRNAHKLKELTAIMSGLSLRFLTPDDFSTLDDIEETGATFEENATLKAVVTARKTGHVSLADDSGLEVDALGGKPGVFSARYSGERSSDASNRRKLVQELEGVPEERRSGRFVCVVAIATPDGASRLFRGECEGRLLEKERGEGGFGYDPLFFLPSHGRTMAELRPEEKNQVSHRSRALALAREILVKWPVDGDFRNF